MSIRNIRPGLRAVQTTMVPCRNFSTGPTSKVSRIISEKFQNAKNSSHLFERIRTPGTVPRFIALGVAASLCMYIAGVVAGLFMYHDTEAKSDPKRTFRLHRDDKVVSIPDKEGNTVHIRFHFDRTLQTTITTSKNQQLRWEVISKHPQSTVENGNPINEPVIAYNKEGTIHAIWEIKEGDNVILQTAEKRVGKPWSKPVNLYQSKEAIHIKLLLDAKGNAVAAWRESNGIIRAAFKPIEGTWPEQAATLSTTSREDFWQNTSKPAIVEGGGNWTIVWKKNSLLQSASMLEGEKKWSISAIPFTESPNWPKIAADKKGNVYAAWTDRTTLVTPNIQLSRKEVGGNWSTPVTVAEASHSAFLDFSIGRYKNSFYLHLFNRHTAHNKSFEIKAFKLQT